MQLMTAREIAKMINLSPSGMLGRLHKLGVKPKGTKKTSNRSANVNTYDYDEYATRAGLIKGITSVDKKRETLAQHGISPSERRRRVVAQNIQISSFAQAVRANRLAGVKINVIAKRTGRRIVDIVAEFKRQDAMEVLNDEIKRMRGERKCKRA